MPDSKITALASIGTGTDPANDPLVIVDVSDVSPSGMSATGTTKKVTLNNLLACSPTATLASATITGDLTVDTSTLKVDSANDRVGIQSTLLNSRLTVRAGTLAGIDIYRDDSNANFSGIRFKGTTNSTVNAQIGWSGTQLRIDGTDEVLLVTNSSDRFRITTGGVFTWENVGGVSGTAMTLNSTGLGVGKTASARLDVASARAASVVGGIVGTTGTGVVADECQFLIKNVNTASGQNNGAGIGGLLEASASNKSSLMFYVDNGTSTVNVGRFDSNGNMINLIQASAPTLVSNSTFVWNLTSNTNLRVSVRGTDGVTRTANITLA
jgi:hypothetical protein